MILFLSELLMFITTLGWASTSFDWVKNMTRIDDINISSIISEVNWKNYNILTKNAKTDKEKWIIFKEVILEFKEWELNPNLCKLLNSDIQIN